METVPPVETPVAPEGGKRKHVKKPVEPKKTKRGLGSGAGGSGNRFVKDDPRSRRNVKRRLEAELEAGGKFDEELLAVMRRVQGLPACMDKTQMDKDCRQWKVDNLAGFMTKRYELERAEMLMKAMSSGPGEWDGEGACPTCGREAEGEDEGGERVEGLIGKLLGEAKG